MKKKQLFTDSTNAPKTTVRSNDQGGFASKNAPRTTIKSSPKKK